MRSAKLLAGGEPLPAFCRWFTERNCCRCEGQHLNEEFPPCCFFPPWWAWSKIEKTERNLIQLSWNLSFSMEARAEGLEQPGSGEGGSQSAGWDQSSPRVVGLMVMLVQIPLISIFSSLRFHSRKLESFSCQKEGSCTEIAHVAKTQLDCWKATGRPDQTRSDWCVWVCVGSLAASKGILMAVRGDEHLTANTAQLSQCCVWMSVCVCACAVCVCCGSHQLNAGCH